MRRWFAILLLVLLPAQFAWSAAAQFCTHDGSTTTTVRHFGHHAHQHAAADASHAGDDAAGGIGQQHPDCGQCHVACGMAPALASHGLTLPYGVFPVPQQRNAAVPAAWPHQPDRPRWMGLA